MWILTLSHCQPYIQGKNLVPGLPSPAFFTLSIKGKDTLSSLCLSFFTLYIQLCIFIHIYWQNIQAVTQNVQS